MNITRILAAIFAAFVGLIHVAAQNIGTDDGYEIPKAGPKRAGTVTTNGYTVTLHGVTLAPHGSDPAHTAWATETVNSPSGVTYLTSVKPEDLVWTGNPDAVIRAPGKIEKTDGTFILENVKGYLKVAGHSSDLGTGILVRITRFSQGTVGYSGNQRITSGPTSQELTRLELSGFGAWLEALTETEQATALQGLRSLPAGTLVTYGYEVDDRLFTQTIAISTANATLTSLFLELLPNGTLKLKTTPAGGTAVKIQRRTTLNPDQSWLTIATVNDGGIVNPDGVGFWRAHTDE